MAKQALGLGTTADDGTGDTLRGGGTKIKENFDELYDLMGDGTDLSSGISASASVITLTAPSIGGVVAGTQTSATITTLATTTVNGTTLNAGTLALAAGSITDSSGAISFVNENLTTTGTLGAGAITGSSTISGTTITASTAFAPDASGGADIGTTSLEFGDVFIADDKYVQFGSGQDILMGYDETTTDSLKIAATEGAGLAITLMADEGDDAGDEWKLNIADGGTMTLGNDINSAGTYVTHLTITPNSTVASSTMAFAGSITAAGNTLATAADITALAIALG